MSFLNSVLSSIGGAGAAAPSSHLKAQNQPGKSCSAGSTPSLSRSATPNLVAPPKRKAEDAPAASPPAKVSRPSPSAANPRPQLQPAVARPPPAAARPLLKASASTPNIKSTSAASVQNKPSVTASSRPLPARPNGTTPTAAPGRTPAKSSYKAILERAEAAKKAVAEQSTIKHKPVPVVQKLSTKERLAREEEMKRQGKLEARPVKTAAAGLKPLPGNRSAATIEKDIQRPKKTPIDLGYKGTMRPVAAAPSYTGTMKAPNNTTRNPDRSMAKRPPDRRRSPSPLPGEKRYTYYDESGEEQDDYDDDESDDMEAHGYDDLEREEMESLRAAQKEDAEALRQESEHRKEKNARKAALQRLADQRKNRGG